MNSENWFFDKLEKIKDDPEYITDLILFELNEKICETLKKKKWNQKTFAKELNVSEPYITKLLRGKPNLTIESLVKITLKLGLKLQVNLIERDMPIIEIQDKCKINNFHETEMKPQWIEDFEGEMEDATKLLSKTA